MALEVDGQVGDLDRRGSGGRGRLTSPTGEPRPYEGSLAGRALHVEAASEQRRPLGHAEEPEVAGLELLALLEPAAEKAAAVVRNGQREGRGLERDGHVDRLRTAV